MAGSPPTIATTKCSDPGGSIQSPPKRSAAPTLTQFAIAAVGSWTATPFLRRAAVSFEVSGMPSVSVEAAGSSATAAIVP